MKFLSFFLLTILFNFILSIKANNNNNRRFRNNEYNLKAEFSNSIQINLPINSILDDGTFLWQNKILTYNSKKAEEYLELDNYDKEGVFRSQDSEDVLIYDNYFYGMVNGVVLESGALDGIRFSNSYFFTNFANWSAIHIGMF